MPSTIWEPFFILPDLSYVYTDTTELPKIFPLNSWPTEVFIFTILSNFITDHRKTT